MRRNEEDIRRQQCHHPCGTRGLGGDVSFIFATSMVILPAATVSLANEAIAASAGPVLPAPAASKNPDPSYVLRAMEVP